MRLLDGLTPPEIRKAVAEEMTGRVGYWEAWQLSDPVLKRLGSSFDAFPPNTYQWTKREIQDRWWSRLRRAFSALADDGVLVRDKRDRSTVWYYTPDAWQAELASREKAAAERDAEANRWTSIMARLGDHGILMVREGYVGPEQWEKILNMFGEPA